MPSLTTEWSSRYDRNDQDRSTNGTGSSSLDRMQGMNTSPSVRGPSAAPPTLTNGNTHRSSNGLHNGLSDGKTKGYTNGFTNGMYGKPISYATASSENGTASGQTASSNGDPFGNGLAQTNTTERVPLYRAVPGGFSPSPDNEEWDDSTLATRDDVESVFSEYAGLIHASIRPLPDHKSNGLSHHKEESTSLWTDVKALGMKDYRTVKHLVATKVSGQPVDDREMGMEHVIQLVAALPHKSANRVALTSSFLDDLWNSLQHPPSSYLGDDWKYRSADGRNNSYLYPMMGAANTPYSRSVNPEIMTPGALPDPGLIFDSVLAREKFEPNPNKVSSIFFNWASLIIHDLFQTDHQDFSISKTSGYLDLSILYGDSQEEQNQMRTFQDGKIKPDCFAEQRLLAFPPSCGVMLIMLNRFHNYVVEQLALINEGGRFNQPGNHIQGDALEKAVKKRDNDLFQTGRLVTCGMYINITLYDYVRTILNLNRTNSTWTLDPRLEKGKKFSSNETPRGIGNQVSAEFTVAYRWHACIGETDERWMEKVYQQSLGKPLDEVDVRELMTSLGKTYRELPEDPAARPFAGLKRGPDGKFDDGDLAKIFTIGVEQISGSFGARNTPKAMKAISILGIQQARSWNLCTLNEYRKFFGLKTYDTFEEVNPDPYVAEQLRMLYEHPDYLELYPGLAVEAYKNPMTPGVGICPNHTISRVVLSDAVALVRGDRFYTTDYSPKHLTNWGYNEVNYDLSFNQGCVFYKLLLRTLPNHFKPDSIYAHYPMTIPEENANIMKDLGRYQDFDWHKQDFIPQRVNVVSYQSVKELCSDAKRFTITWNEGLENVIGRGSAQICLGGDTVFHKQQRKTMSEMIYRDNWHKHVKYFYQYITMKLLHENTGKIASINQVDITRDMGNLAPIHFASNMFDLPIKSAENPQGVFSEQELWMAMCTISTSIYSNSEPVKSAPLRQIACKLANMIGKFVEMNIESASNAPVSKVSENYHRENGSLPQYGIHMIRRLAETGMSAKDITYSQILPTVVAMVPNQSQAFTQVIEYYLSNEGKAHWPAIERLANSNTAEADEELEAYINEGLRLNGTFGTHRRAEVEHTFQEGGSKVHVSPGDEVFCSFVAASRDPKIFPDPDKVRLDRNPASYIHYGTGEHACLGRGVSLVALTAMLRTVGKLKNLRLAPGPQGQLKKVPRAGGFYDYMREDHSSFFPFPISLKLHYDGEIPPMPVSYQ